MEIHVKKNIAYDSPITGEIITTWEKRKEDLKKHDCIEYDPEMKKDAERRRNEKERDLDKKVDEDVERAIERMDGRTRDKLYHDLVDKGADLGYRRG